MPANVAFKNQRVRRLVRSCGRNSDLSRRLYDAFPHDGQEVHVPWTTRTMNMGVQVLREAGCRERLYLRCTWTYECRARTRLQECKREGTKSRRSRRRRSSYRGCPERPSLCTLIAYAHGPGQPLDRHAVSPSPCAPRCTYLPVSKKGA
jgi:hypothetical protein